MPTLNEIREQITKRQALAVDDVRREYIAQLEAYTGRDTVLYASAFVSSKKYHGVPAALFSLTTEDIQGFMSALHGNKRENLDLIIHSPGGSLEAADQIVQYLRAKYKHIRAIVPQNAMSAATMLACACDEIMMGKQSALGPIDPQVSWVTNTGATVGAAAHSILSELNSAMADVQKDVRLGTIWAPRLKDYPPGIYEACKKTIANSETKVCEWLENYMFAGTKNAAAQAKKISHWLGKVDVHKTHGRPIGYDLCLGEGLNVTRLEDDNALQDLVLSVLHSTSVTFDMTNCVKLIENGQGKGHYIVFNPPK